MTKQTEQGAADREAFEAWASKARLSVDRSKHETLPYESGLTNCCWEAFQTGRQSASAISTPEGCALKAPLTEEQIVMEGLMAVPNSVTDVTHWFEHGVRFAERMHGIAATSHPTPKE